MSNDVVELCDAKKAEGHDKRCCIYDLFFETSGMFVGGNIHNENILSSFNLTTFNDTDQRKWKEVIQNSVETCSKLSK